MLSRLNHRIKLEKRGQSNLDTPCSRFSLKMYKTTKSLKYLAIAELLLVPFFSKPKWCVTKYQNPDGYGYTKDFPYCGYKRDFATQAISQDLAEYKVVG